MKSDSSNSKHQTSISLLAGVQARDVDSWRRLVDLYSPLVYFWVSKWGVPKQDIKDVFQDVFFSVARSVDQFQMRKDGSFRGWLRTVTHNKVNDYFRGQNRRPTPLGGTEAKHLFEQIPGVEESSTNLGQVPIEAAKEDGIDEMEQVIHHQLLRKALSGIRDSIQEQTWLAFWMVAVEGQATADVAAKLSMQPGGVRVAKSRVLKRLRDYLGGSLE